MSSAAIAQGVVFQAGGATTINGAGYGGSVQALNATTGAVIWQHPDAGPVIGAITYMNGMVIDYAGNGFEVLDASTGQRLYSYDTGSWSYAAPAMANGVIITGNTAGAIYAFGLPVDAAVAAAAGPQLPVRLHLPGHRQHRQDRRACSGGTWTVTAGGSGITGTSDQFRLMSQPSAGDVQIDRAGDRQPGSASPGRDHAQAEQRSWFALLRDLRHVRRVERPVPQDLRRRHDGGQYRRPSGSLPVYLEIQRQGDVLTAATSTDGATYTAVPGARQPC